MKILALITARGGSKRIQGKNIRPLGGKPLIVWSIDVTGKIPDLCDVLVSTDDPAIAEVARNAGALVPWLRPPGLATDAASSVEVAVHALNWYEGERGKIDGLLLLQPTSPFRSRDTVLRGLELFRAHNYRPIIGVGPATSHPMLCFRIEGESMRPFIDQDNLHQRSQDLPPAYVVNGAFYLVATDNLRIRKSFFSEDMVPLMIDAPEENIDIDTEWDWQIAEAAFRSRILADPEAR